MSLKRERTVQRKGANARPHGRLIAPRPADTHLVVPRTSSVKIIKCAWVGSTARAAVRAAAAARRRPARAAARAPAWVRRAPRRPRPSPATARPATAPHGARWASPRLAARPWPRRPPPHPPPRRARAPAGGGARRAG